MPGETADKVVYVENTGDNAFYTRIRLTNRITSAEQEALPDLDKIQLDINDADWELGTDGWYYYRSAVGKGETTAPLFTQVTLATDMGNGYMSAEISINVVAQAVQKANNGDTASQAAGWPAE